MQNDLPPVICALTHDVLRFGQKRPSLNHAVLDGVMLEMAHFMNCLGFEKDDGLAVLEDIMPTADEIVFRGDQSALLLIFDGQTVTVATGDDMGQLAELEMATVDAGNSVFGVIPARIREWLVGEGRYAVRN